MPQRKGHAPWTVFLGSAVLIAAVTIAVKTVRNPIVAVAPTDSSPLGYTWSLVLFVAPMCVLISWFARRPLAPRIRRATYLTLKILVPIGFGLDILLAKTLFRFDDPSTHLQILVPVLGGTVPIEEFVFYLTGFITVLLLYIWADEDWLQRYNVSDYEEAALEAVPLVRFNWRVVWLGVAAGTVAVLIKRVHFDQSGWPVYFLFLLGTSVLPTAGLLRSTQPVINWRALLMTCVVMLLISLVWEVTLALPYNWWGYNIEHMIGFHVKAWSSLPLEAVLVWFAVTYTTVVIFEAVKLFLHMDAPRAERLFAPKNRKRSGGR